MPKVYTYQTQERRKHADKGFYRCVRCGKDILPGEKRYEWSFRYGGTHRQHVSCGYPKQSQLTQSKMSTVYASFEDLIWGEDVEAIVSDLEMVEDTAEEVKSEYETAAENFGGQGASQEMADELDSFISELQSARSDIESEEQQDDESKEDFLQRLKDRAQEALDNCP